MKRFAIYSGLVALCLSGLYGFGSQNSTGSVTAAAAEAGAVRSIVFDYAGNKVEINQGRPVQPTYPMTNVNGRIYVSARQLADVFGLDAEWDPKSYDAILRNVHTRIHVNEGARLAWVNDRPVPFDGLGYVKDGRLLLSIRAIADYMGLYVNYDASTQKATVADAVYPFVYPINKQRPGLIPIDFATYTLFPAVETTTVRDDSRSLIFSDSPEVFRDYGVLYRDSIEGKSRLFLTHVNGMIEPAAVRWVASNESDQIVNIAFTRKGMAPKSKDYAGQGRTALASWLETKETVQETIAVKPGASITIYHSDPLQYYDAAHAIIDFESDGVLRHDIVASKPEDQLGNTKLLPLLKRDIHDRGTFPISGIQMRADGRNWPSGTPVRIRIGEVGSLTEHWVEGKDAVTGEASQNFGNYGVEYQLTVVSPGKAAFVLVPLRGLYKGAAIYEGNLVQTDTLNVGEGHLLGKTSGKETEVQLKLAAASGSYMPFEILVYPLP